MVRSYSLEGKQRYNHHHPPGSLFQALYIYDVACPEKTPLLDETGSDVRDTRCWTDTYTSKRLKKAVDDERMGIFVPAHVHLTEDRGYAA